MFLIRLGVVALVILLLLPGPPGSHVPGTGGGDGLCDRYPKTCDASVEIGDALKGKLAFAISWLSTKAVHLPGLRTVRDPPEGRPAETRGDEAWSRRGTSERYDPRNDRGTLSEADRRSDWPHAAQRYPGR